MKFIDWFAGIGGFRRGMELAGHECVGFCEFDKYAVMSYTAMHLCTQEQLDYLATLPLKQRQKEILKDEYKNGEWYADDVRRVDARDIPEADCWCFGFPCQDISVAGKGIGFNGKRSSLFFEVMRLLDEREANGLSRPGYLFIENVKNLLSVNRGIDFAKVLFALDERGYDAEWKVLNSKNFNVPQNRERVFVIGHLRGRSTTEVFPVEGADGANCVCGIGHRNGYRRNTQKVAIPVLTPDRANKRQNGRRFKEDGEEAFSLTTQDRHGVAVEVKPEVIGGIGDKCYGTQYRQGNRIYDGDKIATALESHPVGNAGGYTNLYSVDVTGYNATLKRGGGVTETAFALCARDGSGLSGSHQMMTVAAYLLSTKESDQKSEQKPIASPQEKTEDSADTNRKEH